MNVNKTTVNTIITMLRDFGINDNGIAGLLGNLYSESALISNNAQNSGNKRLNMTDEEYTKAVDDGTYTKFTTDRIGYGLAQWTSAGRKEKLLNFAKSKKKSIGDLKMQVEFLFEELKTSYKAVFKELTSSVNSVDSCARIVMCKFERPANQTESNQLKRVNIATEFFNEFLKKVPEKKTEKQTEISEKVSENKSTGSMIQTAEELAKKCENLAKNFRTLYVLGCFGAPMTDKNKKRYTTNNDFNRGRATIINKASADTFGFDCVGMIKSILGGFNGDKTKNYGGTIVNNEGQCISYGTQRIPDVSADGMIKLCKNVSTDFSKIKVGEAVWLSGHIGVYIGNGLAVECTPKWEGKVQITSCNCNVNGYNRRNWTKHGELPWVSYGTTETGKTTEKNPENFKENTKETVQSNVLSYTVKAGDVLSRIATKYSTTVSILCSDNNIANPNVIQTGQVLKIRTQGKMKVNTTGAKLRLRSDPNLTCSTIVYLPNGTVLNKLAQVSRGWTKVEFNGHVGYCSTPYLKVID